MAYINAYTTMAAYEADSTKQYPNVSLIKATGEIVHIKQKPEPVPVLNHLAFIAKDDNFTFQFNTGSGSTIDISFDNGNTWSSLAKETASPVMSKNDIVYLRGNLRTAGSGFLASGCCTFSTSGHFKAYGNPKSLMYGDDYDNYGLTYYAFMSMFSECTGLTDASGVILSATTLASSCYKGMFYGCTSLTTAPALPAATLTESCYNGMFEGCTSLVTAPVLSATTLADYCYYEMFSGCTSLVTAPALPATTLAVSCYDTMFYGCTSLTTAPVLSATTLRLNCYQSMFYNCSGLTTAPELPATTLADSCYKGMFNGCTSLTTAPALPATTLTGQCYSNMFAHCTSLTTAPALPATTLAGTCYSDMFKGCTSLVTAPVLSATTLADYCYYGMFYGCTNMNSITCLATDISASNCTSGWTDGVSATGVFTKAASMTGWTTGNNGIPNGWTVQNDGVQPTPSPTPSSNHLAFIAEDNNFTFQFTSNWYDPYDSGDDPEGEEEEVQESGGQSIEYSLDDGETWSTLYQDTDSPSMSAGDFVLLRGGLQGWDKYSHDPAMPFGVANFSTNGHFRVVGNPKSLTAGDSFDGAGLDDAFGMGMFGGCTGLTDASGLILTGTSDHCYEDMFAGCTSLTDAPILTDSAPCYAAYYYMFNGCSALTSVTCLATDLSARDPDSEWDESLPTNNWMWGVSATGTFTKAASMTDWESGDSGIPNGWTVQNYSS